MGGNGAQRALRGARRHWLVIVAVLAVVAAAVVVLVVVVLPSGYGEQVSGPFGTAPVTTPGAGGPPRVIGQFTGTTLVDGGLALTEGGTTQAITQGIMRASPGDEVRAVSLGTHRVYWSYRRAGHAVIRMAATPGAVYVLWDDGLLAELNPKTAQVGWHYQVPRASADDGGSVAPAGSAVLVLTGDKVYSVDAASGKGRWTAAPGGDGCTFQANWPAITSSVLALNVEAVAAKCPTARLQAYSLATGSPLWQHDGEMTGLRVPLAADDDTIVSGNATGAFTAYRADNGKQQRALDNSGLDTYSAQDGLVLGYDGASSGAARFSVVDARTGRQKWTEQVPAGGVMESPPQFAGPDRVYVTFATSDGPQIPYSAADEQQVAAARLWLYGYDTRTGRLVSRTQLPVIVPASLTTADAQDKYRYEVDTRITGTGDNLLTVSELDFNPGSLFFSGTGWPTLVVSG